MADSKISALTDGGGLQAGDELAIARSATSFRATPIGMPVLIYRYTVVGSDKSGIDTGVDTADAGSNDWTNGDLLEISFYCRTDNAVTADDAFLTFNNDSGANQYLYSQSRISGTASASNTNNTAANLDLFVAGANVTANVFSLYRISVPNFTGTVGYKAFEGSGGFGSSANNELDLYVGSYKSTSAITRVGIANVSAKKFKIGSQLLIYKRLSS